MLTTPRLLCPFAPTDAPRLAALANYYELMRHTLNMPHPYADADAHNWRRLTPAALRRG